MSQNLVDQGVGFAPADDQQRIIPNVEQPTGDTVLAPVLVKVPMVLIENSAGDRYWHEEAMDRSTAERFVESMTCQSPGAACIVDVQLILPCAGDLSGMLNGLACKPMRAEITETIEDDVFDHIAAKVRSQACQQVSGAVR